MNPSTPEAPVRAGAGSRPRVGPGWWALGLGALTTAGLGALTWVLLVLHALGYGMIAVIAPETEVAAPDSGRYAFAFAVGAIVHLATAAALVWLAPRTAVRTWPPVSQALTSTLVAATVAGCALLLTLGISPVGFLLGR